MKNILEIKNLNHSYAKELATITDFSFSLKKGEIVSILGESGSGKTTLLRIIAGLEQPTSGEVIINERVVSNKDSVLPPEKTNPPKGFHISENKIEPFNDTISDLSDGWPLI